MELLPFLIAEIIKALDAKRSEVWPAALGFFFFLFVSFIIYRSLQALRIRRLMGVLGELSSQTGLQLTPGRPGSRLRMSSSPGLKGFYRGRSVTLSVEGAAGSGNGSGGRLRRTRVRLELDNPGDCRLEIRPKHLLAGMFQAKPAVSADPAFDRRLQFRGSPPNFLRRALQLVTRYPILLGRNDGGMMPTSLFLSRSGGLPSIHLEESSLEYVQPGVPGDPYAELSILNFVSELADLAELEATDHFVFRPAPLKQAPPAIPGPANSRERTSTPRTSLGTALRLLYAILPILIWIMFSLARPGEGPGDTGSSPLIGDGGIQETQIASMRSTDIARFRTTATAQVTATAAARSTSAGMVWATSTERASAADQSRQMYVATAEASPQNAHGPYAGRLKHESADGFIETFDLYKRLKNFVAQVTFLNPYSAKATGPWAYGIVFRDDDLQKQQYRLVLGSDREWELELVTFADGTVFRTVARGALPKLNMEKDGPNTLWLLARDDEGLLFVNGVYVADLDLSAHQVVGGVSIATGMERGAEIQGYSTGYEQFTVWELP